MKLNKLVRLGLTVTFSIASVSAYAQEDYSAERNGVKS